MALVSFPASLGEILSEGLTLWPKTRNIVSEMQDGVTRPRTFVDGDMYVISGKFEFLRNADWDVFEEFITRTVNYGNDWFKADWMTGIGFAADTWAYRLVTISEDNTGFKDTYNVELLMMLAADAPEPSDPWPTSEIDPGFLDQRFGGISPVSSVVSGASTTVFDITAGAVAAKLWRIGWVIDFYDLEDGSVLDDNFAIQNIAGDTITLATPAAFTPDSTMGIRFSEYNNVVDSQKKYAFISDGVNDFGDGGKAYRIMYG